MCKNCGYNYTVEQKSTAQPNSVKKQALQLYLEGLGFRSIGRFLGVSHVAVYNRVKSFGSKKSDNEIEMVELDEMHSLLGIKNRCRIWIAVDRYGKRFINCVIGDHPLKRGTNFGTK